MDNPCKNSGTCTVTDDLEKCIEKLGAKCLGYDCKCTEGFVGPECEFAGGKKYPYTVVLII